MTDRIEQEYKHIVDTVPEDKRCTYCDFCIPQILGCCALCEKGIKKHIKRVLGIKQGG